MHEYYHIQGVTDLDAIRKEAQHRLSRGMPYKEESLIHLHPKYQTTTVTVDPTNSMPPKGEAQTVRNLVPCTASPLVRDEDDKQHEWYLYTDLEEDKRPTLEELRPYLLEGEDHTKPLAFWVPALLGNEIPPIQIEVASTPNRCFPCQVISSDLTVTTCCGKAMCPACLIKHGSCKDDLPVMTNPDSGMLQWKDKDAGAR